MMKASLVSAATPIERQRRTGLLCKHAKRAVISRLAALQYGSLTLIDADDCRRFGEVRSGEPHVILTIHDPAAWVDVACSGGLGAGEGEHAGDRLETVEKTRAFYSGLARRLAVSVIDHFPEKSD